MEEKLKEEVEELISTAKRVESAVAEANSFKVDCHSVVGLVRWLRQWLQYLVKRISSAPAQALYDRPIVRIVAEVSKSLERALTLVGKCKRRTLFPRFVGVNCRTDFGRIFTLLQSSIADLKWLLSLIDLDHGCVAGGGFMSVPPLAINDPVISWVWSFIATVKMGKLMDCIDAANNLTFLAEGNERNKRIIIEEGGIPPLLKLLKNSSPDAQIAAVNSLYVLADNEERVKTIVEQKGVPLIAQLFRASPLRVQTPVVNLMARMAEKDPKVQEAFYNEQVILPLLKLLSLDIVSDELVTNGRVQKQSIHSVLEMKKEIHKHNSIAPNSEIHSRYRNLCLNWYFEGCNRAKMQKEEWEKEKPEVRKELKTNCSKALWMLSHKSVSICKKIAERNGFMYLAKLMEKEPDELQFNCLMTVMEIAATAQTDPNFRHSVFKINSPGVRAVVDQLLRVIKESGTPKFQIPAIKSIGYLARIFPAKETQVIDSLVAQLFSKCHDVAEEAAIALKKFVCPDNYLWKEHRNSIIKLNGRAALRLLIEKASHEERDLHSYLNNTTSREALKQAGLSTAAENKTNRERLQRRGERPLTNCQPYPLNPFCHLVVIFRDKDGAASIYEKINIGVTWTCMAWAP
ncbi:hypothetical protein SLEP1_g34033 [Rubroshorea leprosula]|uniref:DUF7792 domain-containing protein n=1 Tax=Rubroshorea leprosula TaxID=152421 RepID=A0AAV5KIS3_9ROSI|nr:hypothetical protein SLEP1_g34033 [Rubroshorea leprosula]